MLNVGVGAVLMQQGKPVSFASRVWDECERGYTPIEKEMKAIVFGLEKFNDYCFGKHVTVESDHKPLETINKKALHKVPKRLLGMLLSVQKFDFEITYKPGSQVIIADTLSRAPIKDDNFKFKFSDVNTTMTESGKEKILKATAADESLQELIKLIKNGFPKTSTHTHQTTQGSFTNLRTSCQPMTG